MDMGTLLFGIICLGIPSLLIAIDIVFFIKKKEKPFFELFSFFLGGVYMGVAYFLWDLPDYDEPLNLFGSANLHAPISGDFQLTLLIFAIWGFMSYFILKFQRKSLPPLSEAFLLAGVYVGMALSVVWIVQLLGPECETTDGSVWEPLAGSAYTFSLGIIDYIMIVCLLIVPVLYLVHSIYLLFLIVRERAEQQAQIQYEGKFLHKLNNFLLKGTNLFWVAVIALLPLLGIVTILLVLFGQQPDSIILAFTKTSDWTLSREISPPAVAYDTHYLCTVSLRGHRKLVKPTRYGIRRGEKIVVNRQLCIANAFEQLIQEHTPRLHHSIRTFYDKYGYPISKHIKSAWSADIVYIIMKPLEWFFLLLLYLFDVKPENRINRQYLPGCPGETSGPSQNS